MIYEAVTLVIPFVLLGLGADVVVVEVFFFQWQSSAAVAVVVPAVAVVVLFDIDPSSAAVADGIDSTGVAVLNMYLHHLIHLARHY